MAHPHKNPSFDSFDAFDFDESEICDLIRTTSLRFDDDGQLTSHEAEELLDLDTIDIMGHFR